MGNDEMGFPRQDEIDIYYEAKKKEVGRWLTDFVNEQKRITKEQRQQILEYAENMTFTNAGLASAYIQNLKTVGKRNKAKLVDYLQRVDWFPDGVTVGVLDGKIVSRILPNELDLLYGLRGKE